MRLTIQPGVKFVFPSDTADANRLEQEFNYFTTAMKTFHNIELEFHPESSIGWLPPYYVAGDPAWLSNQYYRDQLRVHYRHSRRIILWDIGYPEVDYSQVNNVFYDKELCIVTDKLIVPEIKTIHYDWCWNHFKYYATQDVRDTRSFWNYKDYHMPMLLSEKNIHDIIRYDGEHEQLREVLFTDHNGQITDEDDFIHTAVSVVHEPQLGVKTYFALSRGHLVTLYSAPNQIQRLGEKGFWLSDLFDYSYDKEPDDFKRLEMFVDSLRKFRAGIHKGSLHNFYLDNLSKLRDNQKLFFDADYDKSIEVLFKT